MIEAETKKLIIAIDGYSSCGKSTLAKALAKHLGYLYIDSGAMYRAVTYYFLGKNVGIDELQSMSQEKLQSLLQEIKIEFKVNNSTGDSELFLNGANVEKEIRMMNISELVSPVSALAAVRNRMVEKQQAHGAHKSLVMDGRDIGTTVFPNADLKIFMTAKKEVRAKRRYDELSAKGYKITMEQVYKNIEERDDQDTHRSLSPLRQAHDAVVLDNSDLNEKEQLAVALEWVKEAGEK